MAEDGGYREIVTCGDATGILTVIDVSNPSAMGLLGTWDSPISWNSGSDVAIGDGMAFVLSSGAVQVIDLADPANPLQVAVAPGPWRRERVVASGRSVVTADESAGVSIFHISHGELFADGFESGDGSSWSQVVQ